MRVSELGEFGLIDLLAKIAPQGGPEHRMLVGIGDDAAAWRGDWRGYPADAVVGAGLFIGVLIFNLAITFAIGETVMGLASCAVTVLLVGPVLVRVARTVWHPKAAKGIDGIGDLVT